MRCEAETLCWRSPLSSENSGCKRDHPSQWIVSQTWENEWVNWASIFRKMYHLQVHVSMFKADVNWGKSFINGQIPTDEELISKSTYVHFYGDWVGRWLGAKLMAELLLLWVSSNPSDSPYNPEQTEQQITSLFSLWWWWSCWLQVWGSLLCLLGVAD